MSNKNKVEYRCSNVVEKKNGKEDRCGRFIFSHDRKTDVITVRCARCGTSYLLSKGFDGRLNAVGIPRDKALLDDKSKE